MHKGRLSGGGGGGGGECLNPCLWSVRFLAFGGLDVLLVLCREYGNMGITPTSLSPKACIYGWQGTVLI